VNAGGWHAPASPPNTCQARQAIAKRVRNTIPGSRQQIAYPVGPPRKGLKRYNLGGLRRQG
jgi:hypothetical protein